MNRKTIFLLILLLVASNLLLAKAKSDPYVEVAGQDWGDLTNPSSIWSPYAAVVHAGQLESDTDVDAFSVTFPDPKLGLQFQIFVPVCGQHFSDFRPSVALIGAGLESPPAGSLPFTLPKGMGAQVVLDDRNLNGARIAVSYNNITGDQPVYSTRLQKFSVPQAGDYTVAVWEPNGNVGAYMLSTGTGGDSFADRPQAELDAAFDQLFSGAWIGQDCNAPLTLATCATDSASGDSASPAVENASGNFLLTGIVRDTATCQPISAAEISYSVIGSENSHPSGKVTTDAQGSYQIESKLINSYTHIMVMITASGYQMAVADYTLRADMGDSATFDLALQPKP